MRANLSQRASSPPEELLAWARVGHAPLAKAAEAGELRGLVRVLERLQPAALQVMSVIGPTELASAHDDAQAFMETLKRLAL
jgi:hypothetical protein